MTIRFRGLLSLMSLLLLCSLAFATEGPKVVLTSVKAVPRTDSDWQASHKKLSKLAEQGGGDVLFLGDGFVADWSAQGRPVWDEFYAPRNSVNLGIDGDCTQNLLWRIENGNYRKLQPRLIVLSIGSCNVCKEGHSPDETCDGIAAVVESLRNVFPESNLLIVGLLPSGLQKDLTHRLPVAEINRSTAPLADWGMTHFLDVGHEFVQDDGSLREDCVADDGKLTEMGYRKWAQAMEFKVAELLGETDSERIPLFDGNSLAGWQAGDEEGEPRGWEAVDGVLALTGRGDDAQTVDTFKNFDFQCEWKVDKRSNSGIFYRWADYGGYVSVGPEYQILDDIGRRIKPTRKNSVGASTDMYGPRADKPILPAGSWNHTRILAEDGNVEHWLNGMRILNFDITSESWKKRLAKSKFKRLWPYGRLYEGAFRIQNYGGMPVYYRDITVVKL